MFGERPHTNSASYPPAAILTATPDVWFLVALALGISLVAWRLREAAQRRRHLELRLAVRRRTEQLERGQVIEASRNRIMEMLVSNEPLGPVLDAIAVSVREQVPEAICAILVKRGERAGNDDAKFIVSAAPGLPAAWLAAMNHPEAIPFEVWRQRCEYYAPREEPAWQTFVNRLDESGQPGGVPAAIRSAPIGDAGALVLFYPESAGGEPWERVLGVSARLAHIAIDHRRFCDQLDFQAHHDSLTGLPNRNLLDERMENGVLEARVRNQRLAVLYVDVDDFKQINDRFRHRVGDALLIELARRFTASLRPGDTVARIGGDEFNILLPDAGDAATAMQYASRLTDAVKDPVVVEGLELTVTLSIGMAMYPDDAQEVADLQRQADAAMYYAKSLGKNRVQAFADDAHTLDSVRMEKDLRHALRDGWFAVHYQPKFTAEYHLAGLEALIRLNHPKHGQILPGRFISIAETNGSIVPIGAWVIGEVCRQIAEWRRRGFAPVVVAVNVSAAQISRPDFAGVVEAILAAHSVSPHCLELEVTESMLVNAESEEHRQMQLLRAMGICISIDDFGTGFSSLSYLNRLKIDAVKLDRSFVQTIDTDGGAQRLVRAVIGVAQGLGLDVIAEGVETEAQRRELVAAGCPVMQGYLFAHPAPPEAIEGLMWPEERGRPAFDGGDLERLYRSLEGLSESVSEPVSR